MALFWWTFLWTWEPVHQSMSNHLIWESLWCHYPATQSKDWTSWEGFVKHNLPVLFLTRPLGWRFGRGDKSSFRRNRIVSYLDFLDVFFGCLLKSLKDFEQNTTVQFSCRIQGTHWSKVYIYHSKSTHACLIQRRLFMTVQSTNLHGSRFSMVSLCPSWTIGPPKPGISPRAIS